MWGGGAKVPIAMSLCNISSCMVGEHQLWESKSPDHCWIEVESLLGHLSRSWRGSFSLTTSCNKINLVGAVETSWRLNKERLNWSNAATKIESLVWSHSGRHSETLSQRSQPQTQLKAKHQQKLTVWLKPPSETARRGEKSLRIEITWSQQRYRRQRTDTILPANGGQQSGEN